MAHSNKEVTKTPASQTALIIGRIDSLSSGIARVLLDTGMQVVFFYRTETTPQMAIQETLADLGSEHNPVHAEAMRGNPEDVDALREQIGQSDNIALVIISPEWFGVAPFLNSTFEDWRNALDRNFKWAIYESQAAAKHLIHQHQRGRMIFLSSVSALTPLAETSAIGTSLSALHVIARMAAVDLAPHGITVNVIAVGWTRTEWTDPFLNDEGATYIMQGIPTGKLGDNGDIGQLCLFLFSEKADYITGTIIPFDGGYLLTKAEGDNPYRPPRRD